MHPIAPISAVTAPRPLPNDLSGLTPGAVVRARVAHVDGNVVQLRWGGQRASVTSQVPLTIGQQVHLRVEEGAAGKTLLRMVDDTLGRSRPAATGNGPGQPDRAPGGQTGSRDAVAGQGGTAGRDAAATGGGLAGRETATGRGDAGSTSLPRAGTPSAAGGPAQDGVPATSTPGTPAQRVAVQTGLGSSASSAAPNTSPGRGMTGGPTGSVPGATGAASGSGTSGSGAAGAGTVALVRGSASQLDVVVPGSPTASGPRTGIVVDGALALVAGAGGAAVEDTITPAGRPGTGASTPGEPDAGVPGGPGASTLGRTALEGAATRALAVRPTLTLARSSVADHGARVAAPTSGHESPAGGEAARLPLDRAGGVAHSLAQLRAPIDVPGYGRLTRFVEGSSQRPQVLVPVPPALPTGERAIDASFLMIDTPALLDQLGLAPSRLNTALVSQLVAQGAPLSETVIRRLRQSLGRIGGSTADAGAAVLLSRLGLPLTDATLDVARQLVAGRHDPSGAWRDVLAELQDLGESRPGYSARTFEEGHGSLSAAARKLLQHWTPPAEEHGPSLAHWLRAAVEEAATPPEARLAQLADAERSAGALADATADAPTDAPTDAPVDARSHLSELQQALVRSPRTAGGAAMLAVEHLQNTLLAEQTLNAAPTDRSEPRYFAVTVPIVRGHEPSTIELLVRDRNRGDGADGDHARPDVAHLKLSLPSLGELRIALTVNQPKLSCQFAAETPFADALLRASAGDLVSQLERLGYQDPAVGSTTAPTGNGSPSDAAAPLVARRVRRVDLRA